MNHEDALSFAIEKHGNQKYGNYPYSYHLQQVVDMCEYMGLEEDCLIIAALHDIFEDTETDYGEIYNIFGEDVANNVLCLTQIEHEDYQAYLERISNNDLVKYVKVCDILCNLKESTLQGKTKLIDKYQSALFQLAS